MWKTVVMLSHQLSVFTAGCEPFPACCRVVAVDAIPDCRDSIFNKEPCLDFVYGPIDPTFDVRAVLRGNLPGTHTRA